ncbi:MAG: hypothetical protein EOP84_02725 [Verrucomicrobiaceae bacterium]|nr:MAG: hypothetical protein EOP84_02725 [Verrucomicrobiaceae bacterium]
MFNGLHTVAQGSIGAAIAIGELAKKGFVVSIPLVDAQAYDLIADDGSKLLKVQVKSTGTLIRGNFVVQLKRVHHNKSGNFIRNFDSSKVDLLVIVCSDGAVYVIPSTEVKSKTSLTLTSDWDGWRV